MTYYVKIIFLIMTLLLHAALAVTGKIIFLVKRRQGILYFANVNRIICILLCAIIGVRVKSHKKAIRYKKAVLYVGNHLSYLDVLVLGSRCPAVFVTSVDMGERKSEGWITSNAGCVFVERRMENLSLNELKRNIENLRAVILKDCPLCIFPEATSANCGPELIFFSSLFSSVEYTGTMIAPFAVKYTSIDKEPLTEKNQGIIYFYRGERLVPHLKKLLRHKNIEAEIHFLPAFSANDKNRKEICNNCKTMITEEINGSARCPGSAR